jgi:hypothetical protein
MTIPGLRCIRVVRWALPTMYVKVSGLCGCSRSNRADVSVNLQVTTASDDQVHSGVRAGPLCCNLRPQQYHFAACRAGSC